MQKTNRSVNQIIKHIIKRAYMVCMGFKPGMEGADESIELGHDPLIINKVLKRFKFYILNVGFYASDVPSDT